MKKNLYYRSVYKRTNVYRSFSVFIFSLVASYPRLTLEVFIRRNMGERYFAFVRSLGWGIVLALIPLFLSGSLNPLGRAGYGSSFSFESYWSWYLFVLLYVLFCFIRKIEMQRNPSVFDFGRFSLSTGESLPLFYQVKIFGGTPDPRTVETILEPLLFLVVGFVLTLFGQSVGWLILVCSILYGLSYHGAYKLGDDYVMDKIDEQIANEETYKAFVEGKEPHLTRGMRFYGRRPVDPEKRRQVADSFIVDSEEVFEAS
ncbi:MAG: hypothetical protein ACKOEV_15090 [Cytophagales bacterium]